MDQKCSNCGNPINPGELTCAKCGTEIVVHGTELPQIAGLPEIVGVKLPDIKLESMASPSLDFSLSNKELGALPGLKDIGLHGLDLNFDLGRTAKGRPYQPLLVIGKIEEAASSLKKPFSLVQLQDGQICVMDFVDQDGRARVQLFDEEGNLQRTVRQFDVGGDREALDTPVGIVADQQGNLFITDMGSSCVKKFSPDGTLLEVFGSEGVGETELLAPRDADLDRDGNLYIADTDNNRILKWDQKGNCLLTLGINELDEDAGWMREGVESGEFDGPQGVTLDSAGCIFVADTNNHRIQKFNPAGEFLFAFGEEGEDAGAFYYPNDIQVDATGDIYVSDANGGRIQKFDPDGQFVFQIVLPSDTGNAGDFEVNDDRHIFVALRDAHMVLKLEVS